MAAPTFDAYFPHLLRHEGGYVDHPRDPGGATNLGVTKATLAAWRKRPVTKAEVRALTPGDVKPIYKSMYWNTIGGDQIPAGPDAALFDVSVNSGPGRARQWRPLIEGKSPVDAVKAVCGRRRAFFRSLRTFDVFGKGWMRRVAEVEAWSIRWALQAQSIPATPILREEAKASTAARTRAGTAAAGTGSAGTVVPSVPIDPGSEWIAWAVGGAMLLGMAALIAVAVREHRRAEAMEAQIGETA